MQALTIYQNTPEGLRPAGPEHGAASGHLARLRAQHELEQKSLLQGMQDQAVRHKEQGNAAMAKLEYRHAVREYNESLKHAQQMSEFLEVDRPGALNGYQLRALARGQQLPKRGPEALEPFKALVLANRSLAYLHLGANGRALDDASEACRFMPQYLKAWVRRSAALAAAGQREAALAVLDEALATACPDKATKEQVCKLIVNLRALGDVEVLPPAQDLPEAFSSKRSAKAAKAAKAAVPSSEEAARGRLEQRLLELPWQPTHLGGRWRQTLQEVTATLPLARAPKAAELLVQIRVEQAWVLLRKPEAAPEGGSACAEDYDTVCDAALCGQVQPSESTWSLEEREGRAELVLLLRKSEAKVWDRAFASDVAIDLEGLGCSQEGLDSERAPVQEEDAP